MRLTRGCICSAWAACSCGRNRRTRNRLPWPAALSTVVIGAAVVLGLTLHGILTRPQAVATSTPKFEELRQLELIRAEAGTAAAKATGRGLETVAHIQASRPVTLTVGDRTLIAVANWSQQGDDSRRVRRFLELRDGRLVVVPEVEADGK